MSVLKSIRITQLKEQTEDGTHVIIVLSGIDQGLGAAIADLIAENDEVTFASYSKHHPLLDIHHIRIDTTRASTWKHAWNEAVRSFARIWKDVQNMNPNVVAYTAGEQNHIVTHWSYEKRNEPVMQAQSLCKSRSRRTCRVPAIELETSNGFNKKAPKEWGILSNADLYGKITLMRILPSVANAFRRALLSNIPTLALVHAEVDENNCMYCDEILLHRISLIPFRYIHGVPCDSTVATISLTAHHPMLSDQCPDNKHSQYTVTSKDFILSDNICVATPFAANHVTCDDTQEVSRAEYPIALLRPGQEIRMTGTLAVGNGNRHARFSAVIVNEYNILEIYDDEHVKITIGVEMIGQLSVNETVTACLDALINQTEALVLHE